MKVRAAILILIALTNLGAGNPSVMSGAGLTSVVEFGGPQQKKAPSGAAISRPESALPQACRIVLSIGGKRSRTVLCSGSYVGDGLVVTAGHCFWEVDAAEIEDSRVQCGYAGQASNGELVFAEEFRGLRVFSNGEEAGFGSDLAMIRLGRKSQKITPLKIARDFEELRSELLVPNPNMPEDLVIAPDVECRFSGFGKDRNTGRVRFHESDQSPLNGLKAYVNNSLLFVDAWGSIPGWLFYGDSGGPLYCRRASSHAWMLVAVLSAGTEKQKKTAWIPATSEPFRRLYRQAAVTK